MKKDLIQTIATFMGLTFGFTIALVIIQDTFGIDYTLITLPQFGPGLAALVMINVYFKKKFNFNLSLRRFKMKAFLSTLFLPFIMIGLGYVTHGIIFGFNQIGSVFESSWIVVMFFTIFLGALGEEIGWRSFLQRYTTEKVGTLKAAFIVGLLWGIWHVGNYSNGLLYMIFYIVFTISFSYIVALIIHPKYQNLYGATIFHFSANISFMIFFANQINKLEVILVNAIVWFAISLIMYLVYDKKMIRTIMFE